MRFRVFVVVKCVRFLPHQNEDIMHGLRTLLLLNSNQRTNLLQHNLTIQKTKQKLCYSHSTKTKLPLTHGAMLGRLIHSSVVHSFTAAFVCTLSFDPEKCCCRVCLLACYSDLPAMPCRRVQCHRFVPGELLFIFMFLIHTSSPQPQYTCCYIDTQLD